MTRLLFAINNAHCIKYQMPGTRQHVRLARSVAEAAPLFFAEQVPPEENTNGISQTDDWQLVVVGV